MAEPQSWPDPSVVKPPDITSSTGGYISAPGAALGEQQFPGVGVDPYSATALQSPRPKKPAAAPVSVDQMPVGPEAEINKATGYDPATGRVQPGGIYDLTRQKQEATEAANQRVLDAEQEQLRQLREAHKAVAASPNDLKSWDAKKEQAKYNVTPTEAALNPGFWLAITASAFTRTPMVNALNGAAASINSLKDGKDEEFKRAYDAWRQNSELAVKRHEMMHQDYEDAIQLYGKDVDMAREQAKLVAMKYDDKLALSYLREGLDEKMIGLVDQRDKMFKDWAQTNAALPEHQVRQDVYSGMMKQINDLKQQRNLPNNAPEIIALRNRAAVALGAKTDQDEAQAQVMFQWQLDHANDHDGNGPTAEEVFRQTNAVTFAASEAKKGRVGPGIIGGNDAWQLLLKKAPEPQQPQKGAAPEGNIGVKGSLGETDAKPNDAPQAGSADRNKPIQLAMNDGPEARQELAQVLSQLPQQDRPAEVLRYPALAPDAKGKDTLPPSLWQKPFGDRKFNEFALDDMTPGGQALVRGMVEGKIAPPSSFLLGKSEFWNNVLQRAMQYDPSFDEKIWPVRLQTMKEFLNGTTAKNQISRYNTLIGSVSRLEEAATALDNYKSTQTMLPTSWWNRAKVGIAGQYQDPKLNAVRTDINAVATEAAGAFRSVGMAEKDIDHWRSTMSEDMSLDGMRAHVYEILQLAKKPMSTTVDRWNKTFSANLPGEALLSPEVRGVYHSLTTLQEARDMLEGNKTEKNPHGDKFSPHEVYDALVQEGVDPHLLYPENWTQKHPDADELP